jgi:hypothetical protein
MKLHSLFNQSLLCIALLLCCGCNNNSDKPDADPAPEATPSKNAELDAAIAKASDALWKLQGEDGGWHSPVYGHFKPGAAETPLVLAVLARLPADELTKHDAAVKKALKFVADSQGKDGGLGTKGEWFEVPTYATALGILAYVRLKPEGWQKTIEPWVAYLKLSQNSEENGCKPGEAPYGGWGPEGKPDNWRRADISSTRFALQAFAAAGVPVEDKAWERANDFLSRLLAASDRGGFTFSTTNPELNKAGHEKDSDKFRSYGSTTADAILSFVSMPSAKNEGLRAKGLIQSTFWLSNYPDVEHCPGLQDTELAKIGWKDGLNFYYRDALAAARSTQIPYQDTTFSWKKLADVTIKSQLKDGTWTNETTIMKEDDPLIATPFALETLILCRDALTRK